MYKKKKKKRKKIESSQFTDFFVLFELFYPNEAHQTMKWRDKLDISQWEGECSSKIQDVNKTMELPPVAPLSTP
jgi:hypothetical protein